MKKGKGDMKVIDSKKIKKIILCIIVVLMLCNFVLPNYIFAASTQQGGSWISVIAKFLCFVADSITSLLQKMMVSPYRVDETSEYKVLYSPGIIFSGTVPALDINFIEPGEDREEQIYTDSRTEVSSGSNGEEGFKYMAATGADRICADQCEYMEDIDADVETFVNEICDDPDFWYNSGDGLETEFNGKSIKLVTYMGSASDWYIECTGEDGEDIYKEYSSSGLSTYDAKDGLRNKLLSYLGETSDSPEKNDKDIMYNKIMEYKDILINKIENDMEPRFEESFIFKHECNGKDLRIIISYDSARETGNWRLFYGEASSETKIYKSSARILQPIVASWYKALRRIALVGLLSVLVYIGIRIVLTSTSAKDKAKYKKMFKDWLVALCILFVLHYIMNVTIVVVNKINSIIGESVVGEEGEDVLVTTLRNNIANGDSWGTVIAEVVIYNVITVYTVIFTIQYIRRVIYLAFLTTIAPLITLTYPLDKIKDGKAQALDMWIKDYVFFTLLQVLHLLLYYVFVTTSIDLAEKGNWIYAIVAIGFLTQAEKIMKKMFGFEKSKSMGALGAGATGALVVNALNKISQMSQKGGASKGENSNGNSNRNSKTVRTVTTNPLAGLIGVTARNTTHSNTISENETEGELDNGSIPEATAPSRTQSEGTPSSSVLGGGTPSSSVPGGGTPSSSAPGRGTPSSSAPGRGTPSSSAPGGGTPSSSVPGGGTPSSSALRGGSISHGSSRDVLSNYTLEEKPKRDIKGSAGTFGKGVWGIFKRYTGPAMRKVTGGALGVAGGIIGFSAGVAQGDIGKALAGAAGGATAGYYTGQKAVNMAGKGIHTVTHANEAFDGVRDAWNEGAHGAEYAENKKFDRDFRRSEAYATLKRNNTSNFSDEKVQQMLDAGITDYKKMDKILKKSAKHPRKFRVDKAIAYTTIAEKCSDKVLYDDRKLIKFFEDRNIQIDMDQVEELRKNIVEFK